MEGFSVKISGLNQKAAQEESLIGQLKNLETELEGINRRISFQVKGRSGITSSLNRVDEELKGHISSLRRMKEALDTINALYQTTEGTNANIRGIAIDIINATSVVGAFFGRGNSVVGADQKESGIDIGKILEQGDYLGEEGWKFGLSTKYKTELFEEKQRKIGEKGEIIYENGKRIKKTEKYDTAKDKRKEGNKKEEKKKDNLGNVTFTSGEKNFFSSALWEKSVETDDFSTNLGISKYKVDGKASISGAGVDASIGAAYTLLQANVAKQYGDDNLGFHVSSGVAAGKVTADAALKASWLDDDGNFAANLGVKASAEAIAAEANATAGVDVLGADIDVTAGVTVGIGAHADIGFYDGKLKFDVGASMGIGGNIDLEIDISKPLEYIADIGDDIIGAAEAVGDLWDRGVDLFSGVFRW